MAGFLDRVARTRPQSLAGTIEAPELMLEGEEEVPVLHVFYPSIADLDYISAANIGSIEMLARIFLICVREPDGKLLVEKQQLQSLMQGAGPPFLDLCNRVSKKAKFGAEQGKNGSATLDSSPGSTSPTSSG